MRPNPGDISAKINENYEDFCWLPVRNLVSSRPMEHSHKNARQSRAPIPIIDLFAGPGGLGEGFASLKNDDDQPSFDLRISIEKDAIAHKTLTLRAFFRAFADGKAPDAYYDHLRGGVTFEQLFQNPAFRTEAEKAQAEAKNATLGQSSHGKTDKWIKDALGNASVWVLIGGPPCQAYSMAGRSRLRPVDAEKFESDEKHFLYKEYLRIIRNFKPPVFVMENVKGMLSSTHGGSSIFQRILGDLAKPSADLEYEIRSFVKSNDDGALEPADFVIRAEDYGIPQTRHRVILLGIRKDFTAGKYRSLRKVSQQRTVKDAIGEMPRIRSRLSGRGSDTKDSKNDWLSALSEGCDKIVGMPRGQKPLILEKMGAAIRKAGSLDSTGIDFTRYESGSFTEMPSELASWYKDSKLQGLAQHVARSHMRSDLYRYLFASSYAAVNEESPNLRDFPETLLPAHKNAGKTNTPFLDRFRVQVYGSPCTTVVSHIAKDGHYYIHPDPSQCRSLTVREAARLQTFPDNYFFEGNRTQQYTQVGNAVPPLLAHKLAKVVLDLLSSDSGK